MKNKKDATGFIAFAVWYQRPYCSVHINILWIYWGTVLHGCVTWLAELLLFNISIGTYINACHTLPRGERKRASFKASLFSSVVMSQDHSLAGQEFLYCVLSDTFIWCPMFFYWLCYSRFWKTKCPWYNWVYSLVLFALVGSQFRRGKTLTPDPCNRSSLALSRNPSRAKSDVKPIALWT